MVVNGCHRKDGLQNTRCTECVTVIAFQRIHRNILQSCPLDGYRLHLVVEQGSRAMGIHKCQFLDIAFAGDGIDGQPGTFAILRRGADVEGVVTDGSTLHGPRSTGRLT